MESGSPIIIQMVKNVKQIIEVSKARDCWSLEEPEPNLNQWNKSINFHIFNLLFKILNYLNNLNYKIFLKKDVM